MPWYVSLAIIITMILLDIRIAWLKNLLKFFYLRLRSALMLSMVAELLILLVNNNIHVNELVYNIFQFIYIVTVIALLVATYTDKPQLYHATGYYLMFMLLFRVSIGSWIFSPDGLGMVLLNIADHVISFLLLMITTIRAFKEGRVSRVWT